MDESNEGIYVIHTREFCTLKTNIYKLGRSFKLDTRIKQYPKNSKAMFVINCQNSVLCEKNLINLFKTKFKQCLEYGHEYFQGDINDMIKEIFNYIYNDNEFGKICDKSAKSINVNKVETKKEREKREKEERKVRHEKELKERKEKKEKKERKKEENKKRKEMEKEKIDNNTKDNKSKSNIICPKCKDNFNYPSVLKRHLKTSVRCTSTDEYITNLFTKTINIIENNNMFMCNDCNKTFIYKTSLYKHKRISKCSKMK